MSNRNSPHGQSVFDKTYLQDHIIIHRLLGQWNVKMAKE